ncbi:MAG: clostripain-related cysteine peptidase [Syntrophobacteraceae bacterium]
MNQTPQWTWLIYMAGDNNLEGAGRDNLEAMKQVGSTADVKIIVQFDTEENKTTRYLVEKNNLSMIEQLPGVDCGDPKVLTEFIRWGIESYPAQHYLLDVWNHGGGWENLPSDYHYDAIRLAKPRTAAKLKRFKRALFRTTVNKIHERSLLQRAIAIDCGSQDYLDNLELRTGVLEALPNGRKLDILGCDACLMNMLEIAYEMKDTANFMVGSEESEPEAGWPYAAILESLVANPRMSPSDLAKTIVTEYGRYYQGAPGNATQSALDLDQIQDVAARVNELADVLLTDLNNVAGAAVLAREWAQKFEYPEYIDLGDFAKQLARQLPQNTEVKSATDNILKALDLTTQYGFVIQNVTCGPNVQRASGVSIYFPASENYSPDYSNLTFSKEGSWRKFLEALLEQKSPAVQEIPEEKPTPKEELAPVEPIQVEMTQAVTPSQAGTPVTQAVTPSQTGTLVTQVATLSEAGTPSQLARRETEGWMQYLKEGVAAILALAVVGFTLIIALYAIIKVAQPNFGSAKDIIMLLLGPFGTVLGYYFGRLPADARAAQAQQQTAEAQKDASEAKANAYQVSGQGLNVANLANELAAKASGTVAVAQRRGIRDEDITLVSEGVNRLRAETMKLIELARRR